MRILFLALGLMFLASCSKIFLPYEEEKLCTKGRAWGYCGSLSEIYQDMEEHPEKYGLEGR